MTLKQKLNHLPGTIKTDNGNVYDLEVFCTQDCVGISYMPYFTDTRAKRLSVVNSDASRPIGDRLEELVNEITLKIKSL